jgi:REP element-mobilizing transposase RayT
MKPTRLISPPGTYFVTFSTFQRKRFFVAESYARLFLKTLYGYRRQGRFKLHAFVLMPDHVHLLLTPSVDTTLERAMQLIKGGYSHAVGVEISRKEILAEGIYGSPHSRRTGLRGASPLHPSECSDGKAGRERGRVSILLSVSGIQAGCVAPSG